MSLPTCDISVTKLITNFDPLALEYALLIN